MEVRCVIYKKNWEHSRHFLNSINSFHSINDEGKHEKFKINEFVTNFESSLARILMFDKSVDLKYWWFRVWVIMVKNNSWRWNSSNKFFHINFGILNKKLKKCIKINDFICILPSAFIASLFTSQQWKKSIEFHRNGHTITITSNDHHRKRGVKNTKKLFLAHVSWWWQSAVWER